MKRTLGTQLRHLIELLDGAPGSAYDELGLDYRPRYTPVMRSLIAMGSCTLGEIAQAAYITQPAATQTVGLMLKAGLITVEAGVPDGRQKVVRLSEKGQALVPGLQLCWQTTELAASTLEAELPMPLMVALEAAIAALEQKSFGARLHEARAKIGQSDQADTSIKSSNAGT